MLIIVRLLLGLRGEQKDAAELPTGCVHIEKSVAATG